MKITLWGVRAQTATPGAHYQKYGGNTFCIELRDSNDELLIMDLGTGARSLGPSLVKHEKKIYDYNILISSVQYDRILGLPFFVPILFISDFNVNIYGPKADEDEEFKHRLSESMSFKYFPVRMDELKANISFKEFPDNEEQQIGVFTVKAFRTNYLTDCYAYKIKSEGKELVYVSSNEKNENDDELTEFCKNADLLIHDAFFWKEENMKGWGRSSFRQAMERASKANVKKLILFGFNPKHKDGFLDKVYAILEKLNKEKNYNLDFEIAKELDEYNI